MGLTDRTTKTLTEDAKFGSPDYTEDSRDSSSLV